MPQIYIQTELEEGATLFNFVDKQNKEKRYFKIFLSPYTFTFMFEITLIMGQINLEQMV